MRSIKKKCINNKLYIFEKTYYFTKIFQMFLLTRLGFLHWKKFRQLDTVRKLKIVK
jgi:hypothetical protein